MSIVRGFFLQGEAFGINLLSVIRSNEVSVVEGFQMYRSLIAMEKQSGPQSLSGILQVSAVEGCPLSGVPLYTSVLVVIGSCINAFTLSPL